jgi:hypothetical protein
MKVGSRKLKVEGALADMAVGLPLFRRLYLIDVKGQSAGALPNR